MKKLLLPFLLLLVAANVVAQQKNSNDINVESLKRNSVDNTPTSIVFSTTSIYKKGQGQEIFQKYFNLDGVTNKVTVANTTVTKQRTSVERYEQYYKGIKVEQAGYTILYGRDDRATYMNGNMYDISYNPSTTAKVTEREALAKAIGAVNAKIYAWQMDAMEAQLKKETNDLTATYYPKGELVWIEDNTLPQRDRKLHLAYRFNVYATEPLSREYIYIDAATNKLLFRNSLIAHTDGSGASLYSGTVNFKTSILSGVNKLKDSTRGSGINTFSYANTGGTTVVDVTSATTSWATDAALDAHWGAEQVYDYWLTQQGRNSFNNAGAAINSYVHYLTNYNNAFWNGSQMTYGDGSGIASGGFSPLTSIDVCAHEIGHAVCQYTANLAYNKESGAMNEGFSDIWGAIIEEYADPHETDAVAKNMWKIGEEIGTNPIRRMDNPNLRSQPDTYGGTFWVSVVGCTPSGANDFCGVHTNSGVLNYWFYLLCMGGSGTNDIGNAFSVTGIGTADGADIAYQTELLLSAMSTFADCRSASISAATALYGGCSPQVEAVTRAWYAVGVGANYTGGALAAITGTAVVCVGGTTTLSHATSGGTWSSSNASIATVGSTGIVSGVSAGTTNISYTLAGGCYATRTVTASITPTVSAITGSSTLCMGTTTTLGNATPGGIWSSSNTAVATVGSINGIVNGVSAGNATITYTVANACGTATATKTMTVSSALATISGPTAICLGGTISLTSTGTGGTWSSSNTGIATVGSLTGVVTGVAIGTSTISYNISGGCGAALVVSVNNISAINGGEIPTCGLLCWYPFNGNTNNSFGPIPSGRITGATLTTDRFGNANSAYRFNGNNSRITIDSTFFNIGWDDFTISCWTNSEVVNNTQNANHSQFAFNTIPHNGIGLAYNWGLSGKYSMYANSYPAPFSWDIIWQARSQGSIATNTWRHLVMKKSGGNSYSFYLNGIHDTTYTSSVLASDYYCKFVMGNNDSSVGYEGFWGKLDDYGIWNCALSAAEIWQLYTMGTSTALSLCVGTTITLTNATTGGTWSSSNTAVATIGSTTGIVAGVSAGTSTITYALSSGCMATAVVTVNSAITASISGPSSVAMGGTITLSGSVTGGSWSSSNTSIATVGAASGVVTGVNSGVATISYTITNGCGTFVATANITVGCGGAGGTIITTILGTGTSGNGGSGGTGTSTAVNKPWGVCSDAAGNTYVCDFNNHKIRKISPAGIVTNFAGTGIGGFTGDGGPATNAKLFFPTGLFRQGADIYVSDLGNSRIRKINASGIITTIAGNGTAGYSGDGGPATNASFNSVNDFCVDASGNIYIADQFSYRIRKVNTSGIISTIAGTGTWDNTGDGGPATDATFLKPNGVAVDSSGNVFVADFDDNRIRLIDATTGIISTYAGTGGSGSSGDGGPATDAQFRGPGGIVFNGSGDMLITDADNHKIRKITTSTGTISTVAGTGSAGYTGDGGTPDLATMNRPHRITVDGSGNIYIAEANNHVVRKITFGSTADSISGPTAVCVGSTGTLTATATGGTWSSSNPSIATVGASTGAWTGVSAGMATITYSISSGCDITKDVTVNPLPAVITGASTVCLGNTTTLATTPTGGTWSSSDIGIAAVDTDGVVTGVAAGTFTISYTVGTGCSRTKAMTVNPLPSDITGLFSICVGTTTVLSNSTGGGLSWTSSNTSVATIGSTSGLVTGISAGTTEITFTLTTGCTATTEMTVNASAGTITGTLLICNGSSTSLSSSLSGGVWTSANTSIATVGSSTGIVNGLSSGVVNISFTLSGCTSIVAVTVEAMPSGITGTLNVCTGATSSLFSATTGGIWSSSDVTVATVGSTGIVTGVLAGTTTISYTLSSGCMQTATVTVATGPDPITGLPIICASSLGTLSCATTGGTWTSSSTAIAAIGSATGVLTGMLPGTSRISYTVGACSSSVVVTVSPSLTSITGSSNVCVGLTTTFAHSVAGGTWTSSNIALATVGSSTGVITGVAAGTATITYSTTPSCYMTKPITVNGGAASITGNTNVCIGSTSVLSCATPGGTSWTSSNTGVANIGATSGLVTGVSLGTTSITYLATTGCRSTTEVTVVPLPTAITGTLSVCQGATTALSSVGTTGGTWASSTLSKATVGSSSGIVTGIAGGTSRITYTWTNSCKRTAVVSVTAFPVSGAIVGAGTMSVSATQTLASSSPGGTWASSAAGIATIVSGTGFMTGVSAGLVTISYTKTNACGSTTSTRIFTVTTSKPAPITTNGDAVRFAAYPNPTSGELTVEADLTGKFTVYTIDGREISQYNITEPVTSITLPNTLAPGVYMCRFNGEDGSTVMVRLVYER